MNPSSESEAMKNTSCSTALFRDRELPAALDAIAAVGFPQVELNVREPHVYGSDDKEERRLHALFAEHPVRARTMHAPAGRSILAALDDEWRTESVAVLSGYLRLAGSLGLTEMVIHPIPNPDFVPDVDDPVLAQRLRGWNTRFAGCPDARHRASGRSGHVGKPAIPPDAAKQHGRTTRDRGPIPKRIRGPHHRLWTCRQAQAGAGRRNSSRRGVVSVGHTSTISTRPTATATTTHRRWTPMTGPPFARHLRKSATWARGRWRYPGPAAARAWKN